MAHLLRLIEDHLPPGSGWARPLASAHRIVYVLEGGVAVQSESAEHRLAGGQAARTEGTLAARAGVDGARLLRFELGHKSPPAPDSGRVVLERRMDLEPGGTVLLRCDRVDFAPGGVALPHRHRGGGIRRLLRGQLEVTVADEPPRVTRPGDAWFESGRETVLAVAAHAETSFVRVSVLPAEIRGRSSMVYVDPADASRSKPRTYTVYVDDPISLGPA